MHPGWETPSWVSVRPEDHEELQKVVDLVRNHQTAILTANGRYLLEEALDKEGLFLDFNRMNKIEMIAAFRSLLNPPPLAVGPERFY